MFSNWWFVHALLPGSYLFWGSIGVECLLMVPRWTNFSLDCWDRWHPVCFFLLRRSYRHAVQACVHKHMHQACCSQGAWWSSAISNMEPSSGLLFSECPIFSAFCIAVF
jgi:hypothetical protein